MLKIVNLVLRLQSPIPANHKTASLLYIRQSTTPHLDYCNTRSKTMAFSPNSSSMTPTMGSTSKPQIAFISGHMELIPIQFETHYVPPVTHALSLGHQFIIGDAPRLDTTTLNHLLSLTLKYSDLPSRVTAYYSRPSSLSKLRALGISTVAPTLPQKTWKGRRGRVTLL